MTTTAQSAQIVHQLGSDNAVEGAAFVAGFVWSLNDTKSLITHPLSTTFWGCISGCVATLGASIVAELTPRNLRFIPTVLLAGSSLYYLTVKSRRRRFVLECV